MLIPNEIKVYNKIPIYNTELYHIQILSSFIEVVPILICTKNAYDSIISDLTNFGILVKITSQEAADRFI